jgi:hypothetical protein
MTCQRNSRWGEAALIHLHHPNAHQNRGRFLAALAQAGRHEAARGRAKSGLNEPRLMRQQTFSSRLLERTELFQSGKQALCGAFLLSLALIAAAILALLSLHPSGSFGPEPDLRLIERLPTPVALVASELERDAPEASFAIRGTGLSLAYAPTIPPVVQTMRGPKAGTSVALSKRVHVQQGAPAAKLASHRKRAHAVVAHIGERHRRAGVAVVGHAGSVGRIVL